MTDICLLKANIMYICFPYSLLYFNENAKIQHFHEHFVEIVRPTYIINESKFNTY